MTDLKIHKWFISAFFSESRRSFLWSVYGPFSEETQDKKLLAGLPCFASAVGGVDI